MKVVIIIVMDLGKNTKLGLGGCWRGSEQSFFARLFTIEYMDLAEQVVPFLLFSLYMISHPHYLKKKK